MNQVNRVSPEAVKFEPISGREDAGHNSRIQGSSDAAWPLDERLAHYRRRAAQARAEALRGMTRTVTRRIRNWREQRQAVAALQRLDDRALKDIGVSRVDIESLRVGYLTVEEFNAERGFLSLEALGKPAKAHRTDLRSSAAPTRVECPGPANAPAFGRAA